MDRAGLRAYPESSFFLRGRGKGKRALGSASMNRYDFSRPHPRPLSRKRERGGCGRGSKTWPQRRPQIPERGRVARHDQSRQDARAPRRNRPEHRHGEKPRQRGLRFRDGSKPRPGVKRRAEDHLGRRRPVNGPSPPAISQQRLAVTQFAQENKKPAVGGSYGTVIGWYRTRDWLAFSDRNGGKA